VATGNMKFSVVMEAVTQAFNSGVNNAKQAYTDMAATVQRDSASMTTATQSASANLQKVFQAGNAKDIVEALKQTTTELNGMTRGATLSATELRAVGATGKQAMTELKAALTGARAELQALSTTKAAPADIDIARSKVAELQRSVGDATATYQRFQSAASAAMSRAAQDTQNAANKAKLAGQEIYNSLNIKSSGTLRQEIAAITQQLTDFKNKAGAPAAEVNRISAQAEARIRALRNELNGVSPPANTASTSIRGMGGSLLGLAGVAGGLIGIQQGLKAIVDTTIQFQQVNKQLEFSVGNAAKAKEEFEFVRKVTAELGLDLLSAAGGFAKLAAATKGTALEGQATRDIFLGVAQASATMGLSVDETNGVMLAISQIAGKGKVSMEELRGQLGERLPPAMKIAADSMGVTVAQLDKLVENGLDAELFLKNFGPALTKAFAGDAAKNAQTLQGKINLLRNEFKDLLNDLGNAGIADGAISIFKDLEGAIQKVRKAISENGEDIKLLKTIFEQTYPTILSLFEGIFSAVVQAGETLKSMTDLVNGVISAFTGFSQTAEDISFLTRILQGVTVTMGGIQDGIYAIKIAFTGVTGVVQSFFAAIALGISKVTFGDVSKELETLAFKLSDAGQKSFEKANQLALDFKSKTVEAMDKAVTASVDAANKGATAHEAAAQRTIGAQAGVSTAVTQTGAVIAASAQSSAKELERIGVSGTNTALALKQMGTQGILTGENIGEGLARIARESTKTEKAIDAISSAVNKAKETFIIFKGEGGEAIVDVSKATNNAIATFRDLEKTLGITLPTAAANSKNPLADLGFAMGELAVKSKFVSEGIAKDLPDAVSKLNNTDLRKFSDSFIKGLQDAGASTEYIKARLLDLSSAAAKSLGVDLGASLNGLTKQFQENQKALLSLAADFTKLKSAGVDASKLLADGLTAMLAKARNPVEVQELIRLWQQLGNEGKITGQALTDGLQKAKEKLDELKPGINSVNEAFKTMGLQTREEAEAIYKKYQEAFSIIESSGKATTAQLQEAFKKYAEASIAANGGVSNSFIDAKAQALGMQIQVDSAGKVTVESMTAAANSTKALAAGFTNAGEAAVAASEKINAALERQIAAQEKANELAERAVALENKRLSIDKDKFSVDGDGNRIQISFITPESAFNAAKDAGLSDKKALSFRQEYAAISNKNDPRLNDFNKFYERLNQLKVEDAQERVKAEDAAKAPDTRTKAPNPSNGVTRETGTVGGSQNSKTVNVNFNAGGQTVSAKIAASDETAFLTILERAKGLS
jgi:tape measure domain-containing protein